MSLMIRDGDNKFELVAQLTDIGRIPRGKRPTLRLAVENPERMKEGDLEVYVKSIGSVDESGELWHISGKIVKLVSVLIPVFSLQDDRNHLYFEATYSTRTRKGLLRRAD